MFPIGTERGAPLRARVYKFDPMLFEVVASPHGPGLKPVIRSGGMGVSGWDREGGTP